MNSYTTYFSVFTSALLEIDPHDPDGLDKLPQYFEKFYYHDLFVRYRFTDKFMSVLKSCENTKNEFGQPLCYFATRIGNYHVNGAIIMAMSYVNPKKILYEVDSHGNTLFVGAFQGNLKIKVSLIDRLKCVEFYLHNYPKESHELYNQKNVNGISGIDLLLKVWNNAFGGLRNKVMVGKYSVPRLFLENKLKFRKGLLYLEKDNPKHMYEKCRSYLVGVSRIKSNTALKEGLMYNYCKKLISVLEMKV